MKITKEIKIKTTDIPSKINLISQDTTITIPIRSTNTLKKMNIINKQKLIDNKRYN